MFKTFSRSQIVYHFICIALSHKYLDWDICHVLLVLLHEKKYTWGRLVDFWGGPKFFRPPEGGEGTNKKWTPLGGGEKIIPPFLAKRPKITIEHRGGDR